MFSSILDMASDFISNKGEPMAAAALTGFMVPLLTKVGVLTPDAVSFTNALVGIAFTAGLYFIHHIGQSSQAAKTADPVAAAVATPKP